jgi:hypothetical protein
MPNQIAVAGVAERTHPVRLCAVLPPETGLPHRITFRIDEVLSSDEIQDILETARDLAGVNRFADIADQQIQNPHVMFIMEVNGLYDQSEMYEVIDMFIDAVNADYRRLQQQPQHDRALLFSAMR